MSIKRLEIAANIVKYYENCSLYCYADAAGLPTIGWGRLLPAPIPDIDMETANKWLEEDLHEANRHVNMHVTLPINPNQEAALTSLVYNVGVRAFSRSKCLYWLNRAKFDQCLKEWDWYKAGGQVLKGLCRRRSAERILFKADPSKTPDFLTIFNEAKKEGDEIYNRLVNNGKIDKKSNSETIVRSFTD